MGDLLKGVHLLPQQEYEDALAENKIDDDVIYVTPEDFSSLARDQVARIDKNTEDIATNKKNIESNASEIISLTNKTTANAAEIVNVQNTITDIILRDTNQDSRLKAIEDNYANKADVVTLSEQQTITGPKTFTEHIYLANSDGTVDRISHLNNNFIIHSGATNAAVLNIDEGLSKIYAFNKELAFKSDILEASGTLVKVAGVNVELLNFTSDPQSQLNDIVSNKADKTEIPTKISAFENDRNYLTTIPAEYVTETELSNKGYDTIANVDSKLESNLNDATDYTDEKIANLIGAAPETLNTLEELSIAIKNNDTVVDALNSAIGSKADKSELVKYLPLTGGVLTGTIQAPLFKSDESTAAFKLSAHNELNFGSNGTDMYIGYDSTRISDTNAKVSVYRFGDSNKNGNGGTIYCNKVYVNQGSQEVAVKADINQDAMRFAEEERQRDENNKFDLKYNGTVLANTSVQLSENLYLSVSCNDSNGGIVITTTTSTDGYVYNFRDVSSSSYYARGDLTFKNLKPSTYYKIYFYMSSTSEDGEFMNKRVYTPSDQSSGFTTDSNGSYTFVKAIHPRAMSGGIRLSRVQLIEESKYTTYKKYQGRIIHKNDLGLYQHSFGLTVSGSNWRSYGINLILPHYTKFTISTFAKWLYDRGYKSYNRNDATGTCLWLSGSNFGSGGGYGTPLAVFSPDGSSVKVQISGSNTLSEDGVNTIVAYSVRDVFSDYIIS